MPEPIRAKDYLKFQDVPVRRTTAPESDGNIFSDAYGLLGSITSQLNQWQVETGKKVLKVLEEPGRLMNQGISQMGDNPIAGSLNIAQSIGSLVASPFGVADATMRELPGGGTIADAVALPFQIPSFGAQQLTKGMGKLGYPTSEQETQMLSEIIPILTKGKVLPNQVPDIIDAGKATLEMGSQFILAGTLVKGMGRLKPKEVPTSELGDIATKEESAKYKLDELKSEAKGLERKADKGNLTADESKRFDQIQKEIAFLEPNKNPQKKSYVPSDTKQTINVGDVGIDKLTDLEPKKISLTQKQAKEEINAYDAKLREAEKLGDEKLFNQIKSERDAKLAEYDVEYNRIREELKSVANDKNTPKEQKIIAFRELGEAETAIKEIKTEREKRKSENRTKALQDIKTAVNDILNESPELGSSDGIKILQRKLNSLTTQSKYKLSSRVDRETVKTFVDEWNKNRPKPKEQVIKTPEVPLEEMTLPGFYGKNTNPSVGYILKDNPEFANLIKDVPRSEVQSILSDALAKKRAKKPSASETFINELDKKSQEITERSKEKGNKERAYITSEYEINGKTYRFLDDGNMHNKIQQMLEDNVGSDKIELKSKGWTVNGEYITDAKKILEMRKKPKAGEGGVNADKKLEQDISEIFDDAIAKNKEFGAKNKIFTKEIKDEGLKNLKDPNGKLLDITSLPGETAKFLIEATKVAGFYFEGGIRNFPEFSKKMINEFGEQIKPHLLKLWADVKKQEPEILKNETKPLTGSQKNKVIKNTLKIENEPPIFQHSLKTFIKSNVSTLGEYVREQGKGGERLVNTIDKVDRNASQRAAQLELRIKEDLRAISKEDYKEFVKLADEGGNSSNPQVQRLLDEWRNITKEIGQEAKDLGMEVSYYDTKNKKFKQKPFEPLENYFPHMWEFDKIKSGERYNKILHNIAESNNISLPEAKLALDVFIRRNKESKYGNVDRVRQFNMPDWRTDKAVITDFIERATKRIEEFKEYGKKYSNVKGMLKEIASEGKDFGNARLLFDRVVGRDRYNEDWVHFSAKVNDWQVGTKLTLLSLLNWTQAGNAGLIGGTRSFAKTFGRMFFDKAEAQKFGESSGALINNTLKHYRNELQADLGVAERVMKYTGVLAEEKWLRTFSSNVIADAFNRNVKSLMKNPKNTLLKNKVQRQLNTLNLKDINLDEVIKSGLTEKQLLDIGFEGARKTQFLSRPQDLPQLLSNKNLKLFTLFKSFITQQTKLVKDSVLKEAVKGNMKPLVFMATVFPALGEVARTLRDVVTGNDEELKKSLIMGGGFKDFETFIGRYADDLATVGAMGILYDITKSMARDKEGMVTWLAGASINDISEFLYSGYKMFEGETKPILKFGTRQIPIPVLQQRLRESLKEKGGSSDMDNLIPNININIGF